MEDYALAYGRRVNPHACRNRVKWHMLENGTTKRWVPPFLKTAVRLRRRPEDVDKKFLCTLDFVAKTAKRRKAGWESRWTATGGTPPDNPIIFDPCHKDNPGDLEECRKQITKLRIQKLSAVGLYREHREEGTTKVQEK